MRRYIHTGILAGAVLLAGCGKEEYLDLTYDANYWGGISTTFDGQEIPDLPKKQTAALLKVCQQKPDMKHLPDRYVQHEGFDLYFLPRSVQGREFQHVRFLSDEKKDYLACQPIRHADYTVHQIKRSDYPFVDWSKQPVKAKSTIVRFKPVPKKVMDQQKQENEESKQSKEMGHYLFPSYQLSLPPEGQFVLFMKDKSKDDEQTLFETTESLSGSELNLAFRVIPNSGLQHTSIELMTSGDRIGIPSVIQDHVMGQSYQIERKQLPDTLSVGQTVPFATVRKKEEGKIIQETSIYMRLNPTYEKPANYKYVFFDTSPTSYVGFIHQSPKQLVESDYKFVSAIPDKLAKKIAQELKETDVMEPQGTKLNQKKLTLMRQGKSQTFELFERKRAKKLEIYVVKKGTKNGAKLSGTTSEALSEVLNK
ncbi:hypothetical protein AS033_15195 [Exiguobacterium indicum]|uniref:Lipoprotein n=1 Tax=Exiguobacterium indicum TaxID=296995 RepID=A0A0V8GCJ7_9BACL|nr:hypothetical protein [Exiguobacterium enclense]KSU47996.1 hypothetical protein AS033_15195 [Exiguobacterium enclense]SDD36241.1 hypothetical protein SAMN05216342_3096 [Exiguobacterium enclense]